MAACTLLFEGTAEVSLYWKYVITIIMYMYHCVCVICRKWLYRKEEYTTSPQDLGKNILNNIVVMHAVQHVHTTVIHVHAVQHIHTTVIHVHAVQHVHTTVIHVHAVQHVHTTVIHVHAVQHVHTTVIHCVSELQCSLVDCLEGRRMVAVDTR